MAPQPRRPADPQRQAVLQAELKRDRDLRQQSYRQRALAILPHVCARCAREIPIQRIKELTVHHKDHNFRNNPPDGSNWELLCIYCHDHEHEKERVSGHYAGAVAEAAPAPATFMPFEGLDKLVKVRKPPEEATLKLEFKDDWGECREWLAGWWQREVRGHWALGAMAPRDRPLAVPPAPALPADVRELWMDGEARLQRDIAAMARTYYGGAAFPLVSPGLGPGMLNLFLGCAPGFMPETVWYNPCQPDIRRADLRFDPENAYWVWTQTQMRRYVEAARGRCLPAIPDLIEGLDILSEVLGTEELLAALIEEPGDVHRLLDQLDDLYFRYFDDLAAIARDDVGGNAFIAFNCWGPGRTLKTQCDFSAMISPDMFAEFVVPHLERQCARVDGSVYHLDGPNAIGHLPHLLKVPSLKAIQWTPGAGQPECADPVWWKRIWEPVYAAGKSAMVLGQSQRLVEPFVKQFGQRGTLITARCATERDARRLIETSATWGA